MDKTIDQMTTEELKALLSEREKSEKIRLKKERETLEADVQESLDMMFKKAEVACLALSDLLTSCAKQSITLRDRLNNYGLIKSNSKGGFHIKDKNRKLVFAYRTDCEYDFRAGKAEGLLKDFLTDFVKKRDLKMYNVVSALLERNKEGNLEYSRIQSLYKLENEFDDPRWKEAIRLFRESFKPSGSSIMPQFYKKDETTGKWKIVALNLSSF